MNNPAQQARMKHVLHQYTGEWDGKNGVDSVNCRLRIACAVHFDHGFANAMGHAGDACELPDGRWMTKQSFWFNKGYLEHILGL